MPTLLVIEPGTPVLIGPEAQRIEGEVLAVMIGGGNSVRYHVGYWGDDGYWKMWLERWQVQTREDDEADLGVKYK